MLDSPELADKLRQLAARLCVLYKTGFRIVGMKTNGGYSAANNTGAELARGKLLLFLNSDVLPDRPGWLRRMAEFYTAARDIGALGCKLVYEDNSLQHAGMTFSPLLGTQEYANVHYFKGMHRSLPAANVTRRVPAVTAACLMIDAGLYREMG